MVASIRPSTTRIVWVRRRGRLRAAILKETRLRSAERPRIRAAAPKTASKPHMSCSAGTPKSLSIPLILPVCLVARDAAVAHTDGAVRPCCDRGVVGDEDEGLLLAAAHLVRAFLGLVREPNHPDSVLRPPPRLLRLVTCDQQRQFDVLDRGE